MYLFSHTGLLESFAAAQRRGVRVRVLLEERPVGRSDNLVPLTRLRSAGVDVRWANPAYRLTHAKTIAIDRREAWIMTANLTRAAFGSNREFLIRTYDSRLVGELGAIFEADWEQRPLTAIDSLVVSPINARDRLIGEIETAEKTLDMYAEGFTDAKLIAATVAAARRGVEVRLLMSPVDAGERDSSAAGRAALVAAGGEARLLRRPYVHAKSIAVDGVRAFVGSVNSTRQSMDDNREVGLIVRDAPALALLRQTFAADWAIARP
jgi:phosphatidylserine/phosphatidylglycerophosphate/cardiolipin synthase-like enzyme